MTQEDIDKSKHTSAAIIELAEDLMRKLGQNNQTIIEKRISTAATANLSNEIVTIMNRILTDARSGNDAPDVRLERLSSVVSSIITSLESSVRNNADELIKLEATQDGMRRALEAVKSTGQLRIQELERIEKLAEKENPEARRKTGERPEAVATKRNAATLKKNREKEILSEG